MEGVVVPLYKEGDVTQISNYRGVTLGSHFGKLFCQILKRRLTKVVEREGILGEAQGGFRKTRQTVDQLFVLNSITQLRRSQGKKTWLAFLDLRKAFPSIWREGLWGKMNRLGLGGKFLRMCRAIYSKTTSRVRIGATLSAPFSVPVGLREGCVLSPLLFSIFLMDLAKELEERELGIEIKGHWMGACFFADDIVLIAKSDKELRKMLSVVAIYAEKWKLRFNAKKCGVLVVGEKKTNRVWKLGKDNIGEVDEYKYLGVWINRQASARNHIRHLLGNADRLHALVRGAKFWQGEEDVAAGVIVWKMAARPVLEYGSEVWACPSYDSNRKLEQVQERAGRAILGLSWRFPGVVVRGDLGLASLKYGRYERALKYAGRIRAMSPERWQRLVGQELLENLGKGTWGDYVVSLMRRHDLTKKWREAGWNNKTWARTVETTIREARHKSWRREVLKRADLGNYQEKQKDLELVKYIKEETGGDTRRAIKEKIEWGKHWDKTRGQ